MKNFCLIFIFILLKTPCFSQEQTINKKAPHFEVITNKKEVINTKNLEGKVIVLNFWSTGCLGCVQELPSLNNVVSKVDNDSVVFISLLADSKSKNVKKFIKNNPIAYKLAIENYEIHKLFKIAAYPTHIIIDKNGIIRYNESCLIMNGLLTSEDYLKNIILRILRK